jgi:hypothetical protein
MSEYNAVAEVDVVGVMHSFRASRLTRGNLVFPTELRVSDRHVTRIKPSLTGRIEESISLRQVSSVTVSQGVMFADVVVHSAGGTDPLRSHGHTNAEAGRLKALIEEFQSNILTAGVADVSGLRACPRCAETIKVAAHVCRHCGSDVPIELTEEFVAHDAVEDDELDPGPAKDWTWR